MLTKYLGALCNYKPPNATV